MLAFVHLTNVTTYDGIFACLQDRLVSWGWTTAPTITPPKKVAMPVRRVSRAAPGSRVMLGAMFRRVSQSCIPAKQEKTKQDKTKGAITVYISKQHSRFHFLPTGTAESWMMPASTRTNARCHLKYKLHPDLQWRCPRYCRPRLQPTVRWRCPRYCRPRQCCCRCRPTSIVQVPQSLYAAGAPVLHNWFLRCPSRAVGRIAKENRSGVLAVADAAATGFSRTPCSAGAERP